LNSGQILYILIRFYPFFPFYSIKAYFRPLAAHACPLLYLLHAVEEALARSAAPDVLHDDMPLNNAGLAKI
jgi:hypothetical protein